MRTILFAAIILFLGCEKEKLTGINYCSVLDVSAKVDVYRIDADKILIESFYIDPLETVFMELEPGTYKTEYTPEKCMRVLPDAKLLEYGELETELLFFKLPLFSEWK